MEAMTKGLLPSIQLVALYDKEFLWHLLLFLYDYTSLHYRCNMHHRFIVSVFSGFLQRISGILGFAIFYFHGVGLRPPAFSIRPQQFHGAV